jgi:predicted component of type VI protein secretion system
MILPYDLGETARRRMNIRARMQIAKGKLREYEGRLKQLEGRLVVVRGRAEQATGRARLRLRRVERQLRANLDASTALVESAMKALELRVKRALRETRAFQRGVQAGIRSGRKTYRRSR